MKLSLTATGLFEKSNFEAWSRQKQVAIHQAVAAGMQSGGKAVADVVRSRMNADFRVRKPAFVKSLRDVPNGESGAAGAVTAAAASGASTPAAKPKAAAGSEAVTGDDEGSPYRDG